MAAIKEYFPAAGSGTHMHFFIGGIWSHLSELKTKHKFQAQSPVFSGVISADNKKIHSDAPSIKEGQRLLMLGDRLWVRTIANSNHIFTKDGSPFLAIGVNEDGHMTLSATVMDSKGNKVVKIVDNEFQAFEDFAFLPKQPDKHSLVVRDSEGKVVLDVNYLNPYAIRLTGRFQMPGSENPVIVSDDNGIEWPGGGGIVNFTLDFMNSGALVGF